jgi:hypothetical protein
LGIIFYSILCTCLNQLNLCTLEPDKSELEPEPKPEPEPEPEPKDRIVTVISLLIENGISLFEEIDSKKQRAEANELRGLLLAVRRF